MKDPKHNTKNKIRIPLYTLIMPIIVGIIFISLGFIFIIPNFGIFGYVWMIISILIITLPIIRTIQLNFKIRRNSKIQTSDNNHIATGFENNILNDNSSRLKEIEKLYNNGLITKEEYENKRKEIINNI